MGTRRKSRELTMQMLFQGDLGKHTPDEVRALFWPSRDDVDAETRGFAEDLYRVATTRQAEVDALHRSGASKSDIQIVRVPGAWEIPSAARTLAAGLNSSGGKQYDAIVTLGCLLRGETAHYEAIYTEVARGIGQSQQETGVPHAFGVLTCETLEQALDRAGVKAGNKGFEAAIAAIEMVSIHRKLSAGPPAKNN